MRFQWLVQGNLEESAVKELTKKSEDILMNGRSAKRLSVHEILKARAL